MTRGVECSFESVIFELWKYSICRQSRRTVWAIKIYRFFTISISWFGKRIELFCLHGMSKKMNKKSLSCSAWMKSAENRTLKTTETTSLEKLTEAGQETQMDFFEKLHKDLSVEACTMNWFFVRIFGLLKRVLEKGKESVFTKNGDSLWPV